MKKKNVFKALSLLLFFGYFTGVFASSLYLDLMKRCLLNLIYEDPGYHNQFNSEKRENGNDWPTLAQTMIGLVGLNNIQDCLEDVIKNNIPGDCVETGVWRGGAVIFMRAALKEYNITDRLVWVADSFEGLPLPNTGKYPADNYASDANVFSKVLAVSLESVKNNFEKYNLLDDQVKFLKGWFKNTLPYAPISKIALLRLDGDFYESTMDALVALYPKLSIGGYIIIDDYMVMPACARAVEDYRRFHQILDPIESAGWSIRYWKKTK